MKPEFKLPIALLAFLFLATVALAQEAATQSSPIDSIRASATPSATIEAYARANSTAPGDLAIEHAYIQRMIELGTPEMADAQAQDLKKRDPADPLGWGVSAYMAAAKGDIPQAIHELQTALSHAPDDSFLLRTAGQVVAWYDSQTDRSKLSEADRAAIDWMRQMAAGKDAYNDAYRAAAEARSGAATQHQDAGASAGPQIIYPQQSAPTSSYYYPSDSGYVAPTYSYPTYYTPSYDYGYWPYYYSAIIIRDSALCDRIHHHHDGFHHDNFHHDGFVGRPGGKTVWNDFAGPRHDDHNDPIPVVDRPRIDVRPRSNQPSVPRVVAAPQIQMRQPVAPQPSVSVPRPAPSIPRVRSDVVVPPARVVAPEPNARPSSPGPAAAARGPR